MGKHMRRRKEYICTSISFALDEANEIKPVSIPDNDKILEIMVKRLKKEKMEKKPLLKLNLGVKFSMSQKENFEFVKEKLKELNISMSNFYKECYIMFNK
jgi:hypothetical protein